MLAGREMEKRKQTIMLMTEPHTVCNKIAGMPKGTKLVYARSAGTGTKPRAAIMASIDTNLTAMDSWCNEDCAVALIRIRGTQTLVVSLYLDINKEVQPDWLDRLMGMADSKQLPIIMGIDSNAHSTLFGPDNNSRGNAFEDFVIQYGLNVENMGTTPTFETKRGDKIIRTHIDVTLRT